MDSRDLLALPPYASRAFFEGHDKWSVVELPVQGDLRTSCARFFGTVTGTKTAGSYKEYRGGFLRHY